MLNSQQNVDIFSDVSNPLDSIEDIMVFHDWTFERINEDKLTVMISGRQGHYNLEFIWEEDYSALRLSCRPDIIIHDNKKLEALTVISNINIELWLGHFEIQKDSQRGHTLSLIHI